MLDSMVVSTPHLSYALSRTAPSSLRDKLVEIPDCSWEDVGGLYDVKREMAHTPPPPPPPPPRPPPPPLHPLPRPPRRATHLLPELRL